MCVYTTIHVYICIHIYIYTPLSVSGKRYMEMTAADVAAMEKNCDTYGNRSWVLLGV